MSEASAAKVKAIFEFVVVVGAVAGIGWSVFTLMTKGAPAEFHPLQVLDIYYASGAALLLIYLFKVTDGPIKVDLKVLSFEGASGPIIMWVIVFLAICGGMKMLGLGAS